MHLLCVMLVIVIADRTRKIPACKFDGLGNMQHIFVQTTCGDVQSLKDCSQLARFNNVR